MIPSSCSINIRGCPSFSADNSCLTCCRRAGCDRGDCDHYTCKCSGCPWHWLGIILPTHGNHSDFIWTWCHFKKLIKFKITYLFYFSIIEHIHPDKNKCRILLWFGFRVHWPMFWMVWFMVFNAPGIQVRGEGALKKFAERREARKLLGYFVWKIIFFPILGIRPWWWITTSDYHLGIFKTFLP
jgi:hypothetical protein